MNPTMRGHRTFTPSLADRLMRRAMNTFGAAPAGLVRLLAGRPRVIDGQTLDPHFQLGIRVISMLASDELENLGVEKARTELERESYTAAGINIEVARVEDVLIPVADGEISARMYSPVAGDETLPLVVYLHGGGWALGSIDSHDGVCRYIAREARAKVLSVDYRLAPEYKFPTAVHDALAAYRWARDHAPLVNVDPDRIAVAGDSAGGNLAAVVCQETRASGEPMPAFQLLFVPGTDMSTRRRSFELFDRGFFLTAATVEWYERTYLRSDEDRTDPRASPLLAEDLSGLPPAHVAVAGFDPLRDEGEAYARMLSAAGVPVSLRRHSSTVHPFVNSLGASALSRRILSEAVGALRMGLAY